MTQNTKQQERIESLADFQAKIKTLEMGTFVYRGQSESWEGAQSTAYRRLKNSNSNDKKPNLEELIDYNEKLIDDAKKYDKNTNNQTDLNILAQLQHFGAATILIDFSYSALTALWFACQNDKTNAKIFCLYTSDMSKFFTITPKDEKQSLANILNGKDNNYSINKRNEQESDYKSFKNTKILIWEPSLSNNRIIKQDSVFVFNQLGIVEDIIFKKIFLISNKVKKTILKDLKALTGITETRIFPDLYGFAQSNSVNKTYKSKTIQKGTDETELVDMYYHQGIENFEQKKFDKALQDFDKVIELDPKYVNAYYALGLVYSYLGKYEKAIEDYTKVITLDPKDAGAYYARGSTYKNLGKLDKAIEDYTQTIKLDPKDAGACYARGLAYVALKKFEEAIEDYTQTITLDPKNAGACYARGSTYKNLGKLDKAIEDYTQTIKLDPKNAGACYARGLVYEDLGKLDKAIEDYTQTIKLDPKDAGAYYARGSTYKNLGKLDKAIEDYTQTITLDPKNAGACYARGLAYVALKKFEEAIEDYTQTITLDPKNAGACYARGSTYKNLGKLDKAIEDYTQTITLDPKDAGAYYARGLVYEDLGKLEEAIQDVTQAKHLYTEQGNMDQANRCQIFIDQLQKK